MKLTLRLRPSGQTDRGRHFAEEALALAGPEGGERQLSEAAIAAEL